MSLEDQVTAEMENSDKQKGPPNKSTSTKLVEIACEQYDLGHSPEGETFAVTKKGPKIVSLLRGSRTSLRGHLAKTYFQQTGRAAPQQALADALLVLDGMAQEGPETELYLRVAKHAGAIWLDLGDHTGRAIKITSMGWTVDDSPPVLFKRTALTGALPIPEKGSLQELWDRVNVSREDRPLLAASVVAALDPDMPHPVVVFLGEQGAGKTSAQKHFVMTLDPGPVPTRKAPRDAETWITAAAGSWIVGLDNLSEIQPWLSDSICRAVTGDGDVRRKLYTDGEHHVFAFKRCIALNSIDLGALRGDLSERMIPIILDAIPEDKRIAEDELWPTWRKVHPRILGAILDLAASVASVIPSVRLESKPRMADFARVLVAVDQVLGTDGLSRYREKQRSLAGDSLSGDPFITLMVEKITGFNGTSAELLEAITPRGDWRQPKDWPANPRTVTQRLRRHASSLRKSGWNVTDDGGNNKRNVLVWTLAREKARNSSSPDSPTRGNGESGELASVASQESGHLSNGTPEGTTAEIPQFDACPICHGRGCKHCSPELRYGGRT